MHLAQADQLTSIDGFKPGPQLIRPHSAGQPELLVVLYLGKLLMKRRREPLQKYGAPLYGLAWPPGEYAYMAGGGNLGIENKYGMI